MIGRSMNARWFAAAAAVVVASTGVVALGPSAAEAYTPHATLVPEVPAIGFPKILNTPTYVSNNATVRRQVRATDQIGRYIVAGGEFYNIELQNGTVIEQRYFTAFDIDTKQIVCAGQLTFDNDVLAVAPGPTDTTVYVGGRFNKITGADGVERTRIKVGLVDLANCSVDTTFVSIGANGKVTEMVRRGNRLFVAGDFSAFGGVTVETVAELNATNAVVNTAFNFPTANEATDRARALDANPDGTRLYLGGRFGTMTGSGRSIPAPTAVFDISDAAAPVLTAHESSGYVPIIDLQDVALAPDGSAFGLVFGTATTSDYAYYTPTTEASVTYQWRHYMRDSIFSVAITNNAMYVGGHFCKPDAGPGPSDVMAPKMGFDQCTGTNTAGGVWRSHLAALSLVDGTPLTWNPGQDSFVGARRIVATTRGLLVGYDGERTNDIRVGSLAFFDFGAGVEDVTPPSDVTFTAPAVGSPVGNPATISGTATDNLAVVRYELSLQASDGRYLQNDGSLATTFNNFSINAAPDGSFTTTLSMPASTYTARARAVDGAGLKSVNQTSLSFTQTGLEGIAPTVTLSAPTGAVIVGTTPSITGSASDNVAVGMIDVRVRNSAGDYLQPDRTFAPVPVAYPFTVTAGALGTASVSWAINTGNALPIGTYTVDYAATDTSGNSTVASANFTVATDTTAPTLTLAVPATPVVVGTTPAITGTASDNVAVAGLTVRVRTSGGNYLQPNGTFAATAADLAYATTSGGLGAASLGWSLNVGSALPVDTYTVEVAANDVNANSSTTAANFVVQVALPRPAITSFTGFSTRTGNYTVGYRFTVSQPITVGSLGIFDANGNNALDNPSTASVGLWRSNGTMLASVSVPNTTPVANRWFSVDLATPITLTPGTTYVIGQQTFSNGEPYARRGTYTTDPVVTIGRHVNGSPPRRETTMVFPDNRDDNFGLGAPNFTFLTI